MQDEGQQPHQVGTTSTLPENAGVQPGQTFVYSGVGMASGQSAPNAQPEHSQVRWTASEYIAHQKGAGWFMGLFFGGILVAATIYLLTKDVISSSVVILVAILFGSFANRKPRVLDYAIGSHGIQIGPKSYPFDLFKSFGVVDEGLPYIVLTPIKRLMPSITLYYDPNQEDQIADVLGQYLPLEHHQPDMIDSLMRRIRY